MMYLLFNQYGAIKDKQINELVIQGSNNVNKIGVAIDGVDSTSFALVGVCKLPNGEIITTAPVDEQAEIIDGVYGVVFSLSKDITALEGTLRINIQAINTATDKIITSYTVYLCVNEGVDPGEIVMMTADQYQNLLSKIELDVQQDETILTFNALPNARNYLVGQVIYIHNENTKKLYECVNNNDTIEWHETFDFNDHYTKDEIDAKIAAKVSGTYEGNYWKTITIDETTKNVGAGGGADYQAGYGITINDLTDEISVDTDEIATHTFVTQAIETVKKNAFIAVDTTVYPTLADFLDSDGEEGYVYLYPIDTSDLTKGYKQYIWEVDDQDVGDWLYLGDTTLDLSPYVTLGTAQTITGIKTFKGGTIFDVATVEGSTASAAAVIYNKMVELYLVSLSDDVSHPRNSKAYYSSEHIQIRNSLSGHEGEIEIYPGAPAEGSNPAYDIRVKRGSTASGAWKCFLFPSASGTIALISDLYNTINVSEMTDSTHFTQEQVDLITNGKPTFVNGVLLGVNSPMISALKEMSGNYYGVMYGWADAQYEAYVMPMAVITNQLRVSIDNNPRIITEIKKLNLNASGYGINVPSSSGWTADKELATTDQAFNVLYTSSCFTSGSNSVLTNDAYAELTNGKPTIILKDGNVPALTYDAILIPPLTYGTTTSIQRFFALTSGSDLICVVFNPNDKSISLAGANSKFLFLRSINAINGKDLNHYLNNVFPYATNSTTELKYETINEISVSADTTYTLATAPSGTYPEYKGYITNSSGSAKVITLPTSVTKIKASSSLTVTQPTISGGSVTVAGTVSIPDGANVEFNLQNGLIALYNWNEQ